MLPLAHLQEEYLDHLQVHEQSQPSASVHHSSDLVSYKVDLPARHLLKLVLLFFFSLALKPLQVLKQVQHWQEQSDEELNYNFEKQNRHYDSDKYPNLCL